MRVAKCLVRTSLPGSYRAPHDRRDKDLVASDRREGVAVPRPSSDRSSAIRPDPDRADPEVNTRRDPPAVRTAGLTKLYRNPWTLKTQRGIEDLDLELRRGEVMG